MQDITVVATLSRTDKGWDASRQVPTFTLPASVHAARDLAHAARIAADVVATFARAGTRVVLALSTAEATHVATYEIVAGTPVRVA